MFLLYHITNFLETKKLYLNQIFPFSASTHISMLSVILFIFSILCFLIL